MGVVSSLRELEELPLGTLQDALLVLEARALAEQVRG